MLARTSKGGYVPLHQISHIGQRSDGGYYAETLDDRRVDLETNDPESLFAPLIPAAPGTEALVFYYNKRDKQEPIVDRATVIAWRLVDAGSGEFGMPILAGDVKCGDHSTVLIVLPSGALMDVWGSIFADIDAYKRSVLGAPATAQGVAA